MRAQTILKENIETFLKQWEEEPPSDDEPTEDFAEFHLATHQKHWVQSPSSLESYTRRKFLSFVSEEKESISSIDELWDTSYFAEKINLESQHDQIYEAITTENWKMLSPLVNELVSKIERGVLPKFLNELIQNTESQVAEKKTNVMSRDVIKTLNAHFKEIKVFFDIDKTQALERANRCKEIVDLAIRIQEAQREEGLEPLQVSDMIKVDEINGKPVYTVE